MTALTSISPTHHNADAQQKAIASWIAHGVSPVSFNTPSEIALLRPQYKGVVFIESHRTGRGVFKTPYAMISSLVDYARDNGLESVLVINSDIEIQDPDEVLAGYVERSQHGLVFANRYDHNGDGENPTLYPFGFDAFLLHKNHFDVLPQSLFAMGQTWWDYWIPYRFIRAGLPIMVVKEPVFLHHRHPVQYHQKEWERMTEHFVWMEQYSKVPYVSNGNNAQRITNEVYKLIRKHAR